VPFGVYSERFCISGDQDVWTDYFVPAGMRAIVRSIVALSGAAAAGAVGVQCGPSSVFWHVFQVSNVTEVVDMRQVAYAEERISVVVTAGAAQATVAGYLFEDSSGRTAAPGEIAYRDLELVHGLPALE